MNCIERNERPNTSFLPESASLRSTFAYMDPRNG
jgi:hypothetical protein